ncbi:MAG: VacJ family lipoprotein [Cellvibrionaceae bacterium]
MMLTRLTRCSLIGMLSSVMLFASGCASVKQDEYQNERDPWETFNRKVFKFNDVSDRYVLKPLTKGYKYITPDPIETGVSNAFSNLGEPVSLLNSLLQGKVKQSGLTLSRFVVNSTLGIAGLFDVATKMGIDAGDGEDFGQTLAVWGVPSGPYIVVPFLGPSTLRDGSGMAVDSQLGLLEQIDHVPTRNQVYGLRLLDIRSSLLEAEKLMSGDRYSFMRDAYLDRREFLVNDGEIEDDFGF